MEQDDAAEAPQREPETVVLIGCPAGDGGVGPWSALIEGLIVDGQAEVVTCDVAGMSGPAKGIIDALARLQLTARRCGGTIRLLHPRPELLELLRVVGLTDQFPVTAALSPERVRDVEESEQRGVEEGVEADDAAT